MGRWGFPGGGRQQPFPPGTRATARGFDPLRLPKAAWGLAWALTAAFGGTPWQPGNPGNQATNAHPSRSLPPHTRLRHPPTNTRRRPSNPTIGRNPPPRPNVPCELNIFLIVLLHSWASLSFLFRCVGLAPNAMTHPRPLHPTREKGWRNMQSEDQKRRAFFNPPCPFPSYARSRFNPTVSTGD